MARRAARGREAATNGADRSSGRAAPAPVPDDASDEFGGPAGVWLIILFSHVVVYGLFLCIEGGEAPVPRGGEAAGAYAARLARGLAGVRPTRAGAALYGGFVAFTAAAAAFLPGVAVRGLPLPSLGGRALTYNCNGPAVWYATLAALAVLEATGAVPLRAWADHVGSVLTWSVIAGDAGAAATYAYCRWAGATERDTGRPVYDAFLGVCLNPRLGPLDVKMWSELRVPWILLFVLTASCAAAERDATGYVSAPLAFMCVAHGLYANACAKGDHCVPTTWDIFHEQWGWMLCFWNFCGVPLTYSASSRWLLARGPPRDQSRAYTAFCFALLGAAYWVFDEANSQKNEFRLRRAGVVVDRAAPPQLPRRVLENPRFLATKRGGALLVDGWYALARKPHYAADAVQALTWGLICGFSSVVPYWYVVFFVVMIVHRARRDDARCAAKYGADWAAYKAAVPWLFIPGLY